MDKSEKKDNQKLNVEEENTAMMRMQLVTEYERTYSALNNAGIYAVVGGLFAAKILNSKPDSPEVIIIGFALIFACFGFFILSYYNYKKNIKSVEKKQAKRAVSIRSVSIITAFLVINGLLSLIYIFQSINTP